MNLMFREFHRSSENLTISRDIDTESNENYTGMEG